MLPLGRACSRLATSTPQRVQVAYRTTNSSTIIVSPPTKKVTPGEKFLHGNLIVFGILAYPLYTMWSVKQHKLEKWSNEE